MRAPELGVALLAALGAASAQDAAARAGSGSVPAPPGPRARAERLVTAALESGRARALLAELAAVAPHRLSGSEGLERAVDWAAGTLRELGCDEVWLQPVRVPHWERGEVSSLEVLAPAAAADTPLPILALGGSVPTPAGGIEADLVRVRSFEALAALGEEARGKIVLFDRPMPRALLNTFRAYGQAVPQRTNGAIEAARAGAVAAIVRSMTTRIDDVPHTGAMRYAEDVPEIPAAAVSTRGAERLAALLGRGETVRLRLELGCRTLPDAESANVVGEIRGREKPDEIVLIGAHLDAWDVGHGAHDDGAGVAHVLEAIRLIRTELPPPRRTVRAVLFTNEENGLRGGRAYAAEHGGEDHVAAIETDAGGFEPKGFTTTEEGARRAAVAAIVDGLDPFGAGALLPGGGGADISPLREHGVPLYGMVITSHRYFDFHHSPRDRVEAVHERELALGAAALAHLASALADADLPAAERAGRPPDGR